MKLRALRVHGFKSFADTTEIKFHEGITAIVGPNGCGKSNISDAIRWVLGEQRPTAIRGAKMEEAIFQGSVNRRPVNRGSVHMMLSNEDGLLPVPFEEVEIGRIVYRDGGSDYSINRAVCRLKDVGDLCRDTGLGANAYNVIENKMIDAILSDRAEERRSLFEEAAGIGKYKDRRKAAQRRIERAEMDLQRLEDVIAEVQTKVRSLARQKGKAERYLELRTRRLDVEVAVVKGQLETLGGRLSEVEKELQGGSQSEAGMVAEVRAAEAQVEELRIRQLDAERARSAAAQQMEKVRVRLATWERDLAVAEERTAYAERRLAAIGEERAEARERGDRLSAEEATLTADSARLETVLREVRDALATQRQRGEDVRRRLTRAREALDAVEGRERDIARRGAQLEGDALAADAQAAELVRRLERIAVELEEAAHHLTDMESQGDLFADRLQVLARRVEGAARAVDEARQAVELARATAATARAEELGAADLSARLEAQRGALERMERDREGVEPVVRAALARGHEGVLGVLVDFVHAPDGLAGAVEAYLGPLARALVVRDREVAERMRRWFESEWGEGGGLMLLPLDRVPYGGVGTLLTSIEAIGEGAPWVRALLGDVDLVEDDALLAGDGPRLARSGAARDARGVVRLGNPSGASGVLERRERLRSITGEAGDAHRVAERAREAREAAVSAVNGTDAQIESARATLREAEDELRRADAEVAAQVDRKARMDRHRDELSRQLEGTRAARARAEERAKISREDRKALDAEESSLREERAEARRTLEAVQEEWEAARAEESRLAVEETRVEGELGRVRERLQGTTAARVSALERVEALDREERLLREELDRVSRLRAEGADATEQLFRERDAAGTELRLRDASLTEVAESLEAAERRARGARQAERETSDRLHALELERQETSARIDRIRDRLEGEWGRPLERLMQEAGPVDGDPELLQEELRQIVIALERIGPVNMLAVEEHEEESKRLEFLSTQRDDLVAARDDLRSAIRHINQTATELFTTTFEKIRENFRTVHHRLFEGGEADIWLTEGEDPLEAPVEIHASPRGKKTQRIDLLSGGERALTALSLLFAIYLVKPSPFCVLDEVDAPLDENNIGRFIRLLNEFKQDTQFVVITHNPRTIEAADWIYGVTMEEPGVSTIVGVRLEDALEKARGTAS
ncbi:MAG: chromosome segregation protein SMC [Gemmatimonadetes bacterium]|nr:chromosome segregation protein SMC [Gemmatimonadota bacterium]